MKAPNKIYVEVCEDGIFGFPEPPFKESVEYIRADLVEQFLQQKQPEVDLEKEIDKYYGMYRDKAGETYDIEDDEPCFDWKEDELSENKMHMARYFYELGKKSLK